MTDAAASFVAQASWALSALCQSHRLPHDGDLIAREIGASRALETVAAVAGKLGLRASLKRCPVQNMHRLPVPFVAWRRVEAAAD